LVAKAMYSDYGGGGVGGGCVGGGSVGGGCVGGRSVGGGCVGADDGDVAVEGGRVGWSNGDVAVGELLKVKVRVISLPKDCPPSACSCQAMRKVWGLLGDVSRMPTSAIPSTSTLSTGQLSGQSRLFSEISASVVSSGHLHVPTLRRTRSKDAEKPTHQKL
jgi:hypothetical protein